MVEGCEEAERFRCQCPHGTIPVPGFRVSSFGFELSSLGFRVSSLGFRVLSLGFRFSRFGGMQHNGSCRFALLAGVPAVQLACRAFQRQECLEGAPGIDVGSGSIKPHVKTKSMVLRPLVYLENRFGLDVRVGGRQGGQEGVRILMRVQVGLELRVKCLGGARS